MRHSLQFYFCRYLSREIVTDMARIIAEFFVTSGDPCCRPASVVELLAAYSVRSADARQVHAGLHRGAQLLPARPTEPLRRYRCKTESSFETCFLTRVDFSTIVLTGKLWKISLDRTEQSLLSGKVLMMYFFFILMLFKGIVRRKVRWVESCINQ